MQRESSGQSEPTLPEELEVELPGDEPEMVQPAGNGGLSRRLFGATLNYGMGQILPKVVGFLLVPVYFSILSPKDIGLIDMAMSFGAALVIIMRCGVPGAVSRFYFDHREGPDLSDYVTTVARFINFTSLAVGLLAIVIYPWFLQQFLPGVPLWPFIVMVVVAQIFAGNSEIQRRLMQAREQARYSAVLNIIFSFSNIGLTLLFVVALRWGATGVFLAQLIVAGSFFIQAYHYMWPLLKGRFRSDMLKSSLAYGLGILPSHVLGAFEPLLMGSILTRAESLAAVGQLGLATRLTSPLDVLVSAFTLAFNPVYFAVRRHETAEGQRELARTAAHVWLGTVLGCLVVALLGPPLVLLCIPEKFHPAAPLIPILTLDFLATTLYILLAAEISYSKRVWQISISAACGLATTLIIALLTADDYGAYGIAWARVVGTCVATTVAIGFSLQTLSVPHKWWQLFRTLALAILCFGIVTEIPRQNAWQALGLACFGVVLFLSILAAIGDRPLREIAGAARRTLLRS
jgi:O-antigen/teichoic acid export membrane protein